MAKFVTKYKVNGVDYNIYDDGTITDPQGNPVDPNAVRQQVAKAKEQPGSVAALKPETPNVLGSNFLTGYLAKDVLGGGGKEAAKAAIMGLGDIAPGSEAYTGLEAAAAAGDPTAAALSSLGEAANPAPGMFSISNIGSAGNAILPLAGLAGAYNEFGSHPEMAGTGRGALQGALSGAAMGSYFGPIGAGVGGVIGLGAGLINQKSRTRVEEHKRDALASQGIMVPEDETADHGKRWENNPTFRESRNEADLKGHDISDASDFYMLNPNWGSLDQAKRDAIAQKAIDLGIIREQHGTIDLDKSNADFQKFYSEQTAAPAAGGTPGSGGGGTSPKKRRAEAVLSSLAPTAIQTPDYTKSQYQIQIKNPYLNMQG
jgi:hypothetical protein